MVTARSLRTKRTNVSNAHSRSPTCTSVQTGALCSVCAVLDLDGSLRRGLIVFIMSLPLVTDCLVQMPLSHTQVPVEKIVEVFVDVPSERIVEKIVEVPVERVVIKEVPVEVVKEVIVEKIVEVRSLGRMIIRVLGL